MPDDTTFVSLEEEFEDDPDYALFRAVDRVVDRICIAMDEQGVSQSELARRLGVSRQHISAFIADPGNPTLRSIVQLAHALDLDVDIRLETRRAQVAVDATWQDTIQSGEDWRKGQAVRPATGGMAFDDIKPAA